MKSGIHPVYRPVVFQDVSAGKGFITRSTVQARETIAWEDGNNYPLVKLDISSYSHPFYTGQQKLIDTAGRIDRFKKRMEAAKPAVERKAAKVGIKQLAHVGHAVKRKILSTAPKKEDKSAAKPKAEKKDKAPAKKS